MKQLKVALDIAFTALVLIVSGCMILLIVAWRLIYWVLIRPWQK